MSRRARLRVPALAAVLAVLSMLAPGVAHAAGKTVHITKSDSGGTGVAGATFTLYKDDAPVGGGPPKGAEDTTVAGTCTTGANGQCDITDVPPGNYWVSETTAPAGYVPAADSQLEVKKGKKKVFEVVVVDDKKALKARVNDPSGDAAVEDGTHIYQFGPSVAVAPCGKPGDFGAAPGPDCPIVFAAYNDSVGFVDGGDVSGVGVSISYDGGDNWLDLGSVPPRTDELTFILGQPSVTWDPGTQRFLLAADVITNEDGTIVHPALSWSFDPIGRNWSTPTQPIDASHFFNTGTVTHELKFGAGYRDAEVTSLSRWPQRSYVTATASAEDGSSSQILFSYSDDGGRTWSETKSLSGPGTYDFADVVVAPHGIVNVTWMDYGAPGVNDFWFRRSVDGGRRFGPAVLIGSNVPESGSTGTCGTSTTNTLFGRLVPFDAPSVAVDPANPDHVFAVYPGHGDGADEGDLTFSYSVDGGATWLDAVPWTGADVQFSPDMWVTRDGRLAISNETSDGVDVGLQMTFADVLGSLGQTPLRHIHSVETVEPVSPLPATETPYDTQFGPCFGFHGTQVTSLGTGFGVTWTGGDPGPAGNDGVDQNIFWSAFDTPLATDTEVEARFRRGRLSIDGSVLPAPRPSAKVRIEVGSQVFPTRTTPSGRFSLDLVSSSDLAQLAARGCRVVATFRGSAGRLASRDAVRFDC